MIDIQIDWERVEALLTEKCGVSPDAPPELLKAWQEAYHEDDEYLPGLIYLLALLALFPPENVPTKHFSWKSGKFKSGNFRGMPTDVKAIVAGMRAASVQEQLEAITAIGKL